MVLSVLYCNDIHVSHHTFDICDGYTACKSSSMCCKLNTYTIVPPFSQHAWPSACSASSISLHSLHLTALMVTTSSASVLLSSEATLSYPAWLQGFNLLQSGSKYGYVAINALCTSRPVSMFLLSSRSTSAYRAALLTSFRCLFRCPPMSLS